MSNTPSNTPINPVQASRSTPLTFKATKQQAEAIKAAAHKQGVSVSSYIFNKVTKP